MRPALIFLVLLGLMGADGPSLAAPLNRGPTTAPGQPPRTNPTQPEDNDDDDARPAVGRNAQAPGARPGERRRRSYASCNRESHKQNLRGGARRRFLIRCKLGFERKRTPPPRQAEPAPTGKRP